MNGINSAAGATPFTLQFAAAANSFFPILVFNDLLRDQEPGIDRVDVATPSGPAVETPGYSLPTTLAASLSQLVIEKPASDAAFDLVVRHAKTGFTFFYVQGHHYDYDAKAQLLSITGGQLLISREFAKSLGRPSDAATTVGKISIGATMQPIEITHVDENDNVKSATLPALEPTQC